LYKNNIKTIILDHHLLEGEPSPHCYLINSQLSQYPNKELTGSGTTLQFCRYLDKVNNTTYSKQYLDLCALGLIGDMASLHSFETKQLINLGIQPENIKNPFIYGMWQKNKFKLGETPTA